MPSAVILLNFVSSGNGNKGYPLNSGCKVITLVVQLVLVIIQCKKCTGIKGSMYKVMKTFICRGYAISIPVTSTGCTSVDIGDNANLELVDKSCNLGDMLSVDGDADAAVENRIRIGWNKFRQLVPLTYH